MVGVLAVAEEDDGSERTVPAKVEAGGAESVNPVRQQPQRPEQLRGLLVQLLDRCASYLSEGFGKY